MLVFCLIFPTSSFVFLRRVNPKKKKSRAKGKVKSQREGKEKTHRKVVLQCHH